jgi:hypothetical protein
LTPSGFAEKSRLTVEYLSFSFGFFRQAKQDCAVLLKAAQARGFSRIALAGKSDLAEIAAICALESEVKIIAVIDGSADSDRFAGLPLVRHFDDLTDEPDAVVVTDLVAAQATCDLLVTRFGTDRVLIPGLLRVRLHDRPGQVG